MLKLHVLGVGDAFTERYHNACLCIEEPSSGTVSYTHLDVYKRQRLSIVHAPVGKPQSGRQGPMPER